jgi:predicted MFS family arabinose efflux permease
MLFAQSVIGLMFGLIAALIITGVVTIWLLASATLVMGCMFAVMGPARQAWIGDLLEGEMLASGVALQQLMMNATRIVGPLLAGVLIATEGIGAGGAYVVMAVVFTGVVGSLGLMAPAPPRKKARPTSVMTDMTEGVRYIARSPQVRLLTLTFLGVVLSGFSYQTIMPGFLKHGLGHPASQLGIIYGTTAAGGIITTLVLAARPPVGNTFTLMFGFGVALAASLFLLAISPTFLAALAIAALVGAASSGFQMLNNVSLMQRAEPAYFGRVMAVSMMAFGANSIVALPIGEIADQVGERLTMAMLSGLCLAIVIAGYVASRSVSREAEPLAEPKLVR